MERVSGDADRTRLEARTADESLDHVMRPLEVAAGDTVSVHTPSGHVSVERGPVATLRLSTPASQSEVGVATKWTAGLQVAVERSVGVDAPVDIHLELPAGVSLGAASTGGGDVTVRGVDGSPAIESDAGAVTVTDVESVDTVRTNRGDATVALTSLPEDGVVEVVDGDLSLELGASLDATIDVVAPDGDIAAPTDALDEVSIEEPERFRGTVGDGDSWLTAKACDGDVTIELA
jgi:hypothetical protein